MELIVFDLDGTLLDGQSKVSRHTRATLRALCERDIAYTVATGRTLHAARDLLHDHGFDLPHIYKNGVIIWHPQSEQFSHSNLLTLAEVHAVLAAFETVGVTPFVFTLDLENMHAVFHAPLRNAAERRLVKLFAHDRGLGVFPIEQLPVDAAISNISALGTPQAIDAVQMQVAAESHLVAYAGQAIEGEEWQWIDIHHSAASKGGAISQLKADLGVSRVICFGDSENDLSMFAVADEAYAPANAKPQVLNAATAVIGAHDEDGISHFLRERFQL